MILGICLLLVSVFVFLTDRPSFPTPPQLTFLPTVIISESAISLLDTSSLSPLARQGGVLTPMSALGEELIRKLEVSGRFEFESRVLGEGGDGGSSGSGGGGREGRKNV